MNDLEFHRLDTVLSALGAIRQDVRSLIAVVARLEGNVPLTAPEAPTARITDEGTDYFRATSCLTFKEPGKPDVHLKGPSGCNCHVKDEAVG